ncbi:PASTA domain-containing protein [Halosquirtibacter xylanolyticus]|uniref:PASTA domain-containing protein n=1 Tax=Halosquirtibacter xylanolyticus TaxID=3374599 RepID=UPI003748EFAA|nr:PASTA domain-containing protein [Prolixibacteraceae bacterium]
MSFIEVAKSKLYNTLETFKVFIRTKLFLYNLLGLFVLIPVIIWITMFCIKIYTKHGESIILPNYAGLQINELKQSDHVLVRLTVSDSIFKYGIEPGTVMEQTPEPGSKIKEGRKVFVTIASHNPKEIQMPKLVNGSIRKAKLKISRRGLELGKITLVPSPYEDLVLSQKVEGKEIPSGDKVFLGSVVDLEVGSSLNVKEIEIPDLSGINIEEVKQLLDDRGLSLGVVIYDDSFVTAEDSLEAHVSTQQPKVEEGKVKQGSFIDIWLTSVKDTIVIQ